MSPSSRIRKRLVRIVNLNETRSIAVRFPRRIRMIDLGETPVGGLDLDGGGVVVDSEDVVEAGGGAARSGGQRWREELGGGGHGRNCGEGEGIESEFGDLRNGDGGEGGF